MNNNNDLDLPANQKVVDEEEIKKGINLSYESNASENDAQSCEKYDEKDTKKSESINISNDDIYQSINALSVKVDFLSRLFSEKIQSMGYEEKIADLFNKELQKNKEDICGYLIRQILLGIIEIRDSILRIADYYRGKPEGEQNISIEIFAGYALEIQDILEKNVVEYIRAALERILCQYNKEQLRSSYRK